MNKGNSKLLSIVYSEYCENFSLTALIITPPLQESSRTWPPSCPRTRWWPRAAPPSWAGAPSHSAWCRPPPTARQPSSPSPGHTSRRVILLHNTDMIFMVVLVSSFLVFTASGLRWIFYCTSGDSAG